MHACTQLDWQLDWPWWPYFDFQYVKKKGCYSLLTSLSFQLSAQIGLGKPPDTRHQQQHPMWQYLPPTATSPFPYVCSICKASHAPCLTLLLLLGSEDGDRDVAQDNVSLISCSCLHSDLSSCMTHTESLSVLVDALASIKTSFSHSSVCTLPSCH